MRISANLGAKLRSRPTVDVDVDSFAVLFFFIGSLRVAGGSSSFSVAYAAGGLTKRFFWVLGLVR